MSGASSQAVISPPWALGLCDRCGFSYLLSQLHWEIYDERENGLRVCVPCLDKDQPQLQLGRIDTSDPQSLLNPRPDVGVPGSTSYFGWMPVGSPIVVIQCTIGNVTVAVG